MPSTLKPRFKHECKHCVFLGAHIHNQRWHDLYYCPANLGEPTVIARYGEGGDYMSGMCFAGTLEPLTVAKKMAEKRGLIHEPSTTSTGL